jgi:hypothetical protein|tara:strand:- start:23865 stop:24119 length:255 start_codon:yes stop_codon:yes gene_type:complete
MSNKPQMNVNIDIKNTRPITSPEGNQVFSEGVILRKVSRFVTGTAEDGVIPVPCFYDVVTGKVLVELLPKDLRAEFEESSDDTI